MLIHHPLFTATKIKFTLTFFHPPIHTVCATQNSFRYWCTSNGSILNPNVVSKNATSIVLSIYTIKTVRLLAYERILLIYFFASEPNKRSKQSADRNIWAKSPQVRTPRAVWHGFSDEKLFLDFILFRRKMQIEDTPWRFSINATSPHTLDTHTHTCLLFLPPLLLSPFSL